MKKVLMFVGGIVIGMIILGIIIFVIVSFSSKKLVCKSSQGDITIMYTDKTITGYTASGLTYDMDGQKAYAEQVGITAYLDEFSSWFNTELSGSCTKK